jgi:hypothetical protein
MITVTRKKGVDSFNIYGNHQFFRLNREVVFCSDEYGFIIRVPSISDECTLNSVCPNGERSFVMNVRGKDLKSGVYQVDEEESNEDRIVINYLS